MCDIVEFKTRSQLLKDWLNEVIDINQLSENENISSAMILWETKNKKGESVLMHARYNCGAEEYDWYKRCLESQSFNLKVDEYLRKHINDYLEFIN